MRPTVTVLSTSVATMLTDQAACLLVRQVAAGGPIGELPLLRGVFELRQFIAAPCGDFPASTRRRISPGRRKSVIARLTC
jgi:hypothetical protein